MFSCDTLTLSIGESAMNKYRKLVAAAVGVVAILLGPTVFGITPGEEFFGIGQDKVTQGVIGILTALGVWGAKNDAA